ncbi:hypothetical protein J7E73_23485 [Paenibacillus albidus]|uniref:hypothetical protein n=1 Tax=Paenibacillus albidus TaxID=2041023 RepID=UPI001BE825D2|nr:hypothetical protein [Paenibacillus albidus]MBT2292040.1 hypothetical protein [Paenibacillus albidus]
MNKLADEAWSQESAVLRKHYLLQALQGESPRFEMDFIHKNGGIRRSIVTYVLDSCDFRR